MARHIMVQQMMVLVLVLFFYRPILGDFVYADFNETTGLVFVGSAGTSSCWSDPLLAYGARMGTTNPDGNPDLFNQNVVNELSESTDIVSQSSVETNQAIYNAEIEEAQAGFLHRQGTISQPDRCAVRARLTPSNPDKAGAMWYRNDVPVSNGFDTYFTFQISDHSKECTLHKDQYFSQISYRTCSVHGGDGFAFVVQYAPVSQYNGTFLVGQNGGQMGFGGIPNSLAIAFDTWQNPGEDQLGVDHVSIQSLGSGPNDALEAGLLGMPRAHDLADGVVHLARIKYYGDLQPQYFPQLSASPSLLPYLLDNGEQKRVGTLLVYLDEGIAEDVPLIAMPINLTLVVKMPSDKAYVGFTSSTGRFYEKHDILSWTWCDQEPCETPNRSEFDMRQTSAFKTAPMQTYTPGAGYGGTTGTEEVIPTHNQNPKTDPWEVPVEHFSSSRTHGLSSDGANQVPPNTNY